MKSLFKAGAGALFLLWCHLCAYGQGTDLLLNHPKWTYGIYAGAGFTSQSLSVSKVIKWGGNGRGYSMRNGSFEPYQTISVGGYATRRLNARWALRSELLLHSNSYGSTALSVGLFPRYRILPWLQLEAGVEASQVLSGPGANDSKFWLGLALGRKDMEFNFRFAPGFMPGESGRKGNFFSTTQVGVSLPLNNLGRSFKRKK